MSCSWKLLGYKTYKTYNAINNNMILTFEDCFIVCDANNNDVVHAQHTVVKGCYLSTHVYRNFVFAMQRDFSSIDVFAFEQASLRKLHRIPLSAGRKSDIALVQTHKYTNACVFVNNCSRTLHIIQLNCEGNIMNESIVSIGFEETVATILFQDSFFYLICDGGEESTKIVVLRPDFINFGNVHCPSSMVQPVMIGKELRFLVAGNIESFDMLDKTQKTILSNGRISSFTVLDGAIVVAIDNDVFEVRDIDLPILNPIYTNVPQTGSVYMTSSKFGNDFRHSLSTMTECFVHTYLPPQLDRNQKSIIDILCELSINVFTNEDIFNKVGKIRLGCIHFETIREINKHVIFGQDVLDIIHPPRQMFDKYYNYQYIIKDMGMISNTKDDSLKRSFQEFLRAKGIDVNYSYLMSGQYHLVLPMHAKGWHNNIESVPKKQSDVVYFVTTDKNHYGGSFFLYRHPYSKAIHAVPDVHGTMKQFFLKSSQKEPLWHAIGSFTATRISLGFSKRSDQEVREKHDD